MGNGSERNFYEHMEKDKNKADALWRKWHSALF